MILSLFSVDFVGLLLVSVYLLIFNMSSKLCQRWSPRQVFKKTINVTVFVFIRQLILGVVDLPLYPHVKYRITTPSPSYCLRI